MESVAKLYQIAVLITDEEKRIIVASQNCPGESELVLDISGDEAVARYQGLVELFNSQPTQN